MALGDYLRDDEWDACFYASMGQHSGVNFGESMRMTISRLLRSGYVFEGIDEHGGKQRQVPSSNSLKGLVFFGNPNDVDVLQLLDSGRTFLKRHLPELVDETDDEWQSQMERARENSPTA